MTDDRRPDETQTEEGTAAPVPETLPETEHIKDDGEPLGANLA